MSARHRYGWSAAGALWVVLGANVLQAENLLQNPDFDSDLSHWTLSNPGGGSFVPDLAGEPRPGSALGTVVAQVATYIALTQCVPVEPLHTYQNGLTCRVPSGQSAAGECYVAVSWYSTPDCQSPGFLSGVPSQPIATVNGWQRYAWLAPSAAGAASAQVMLLVSKQDAQGTFGAYLDSAYFGPPQTGDLNGDGRQDLLLHNTATGQNRLWTMDGGERLATTIVVPQAGPNWELVGVNDFGGPQSRPDTRADLLFWSSATGALAVWIMDGAESQSQGALASAAPLPTSWHVAATGDFDHDGRPDILWRNQATQKLQVWLTDGAQHTGTLVPSPDQAVDSNWFAVAAQDFNHDGDLDLLWYNPTSGKIVQWFLDAGLQRIAGQFVSPPNAGDNNWQVLAGGDYGVGPGGIAGSNDVVWRNQTSGRFVVWYLDHAGNRTSGGFTNPDGPSANPTDWTIVGPR